jgi:delta 1-pyrroline-5-carboxylate dehydrogenase
LIRVEIIANRSVEDNITEALKAADVAKFWTKAPVVHGVGAKGPRMGDSVWPEENFMMVVWCEEDEARRIKKALEPVKAQYPNEGIKMFGID